MYEGGDGWRLQELLFVLTHWDYGLVNYTVTGFLPPRLLCPGSYPAGKCGPQQTQILRALWFLVGGRQWEQAGDWGEGRRTLPLLRVASGPPLGTLLDSGNCSLRPFRLNFSENLLLAGPGYYSVSLVPLYPASTCNVHLFRFFQSFILVCFLLGPRLTQETPVDFGWGVFIKHKNCKCLRSFFIENCSFLWSVDSALLLIWTQNRFLYVFV